MGDEPSNFDSMSLVRSDWREHGRWSRAKFTAALQPPVPTLPVLFIGAQPNWGGARCVYCNELATASSAPKHSRSHVRQ